MPDLILITAHVGYEGIRRSTETWMQTASEPHRLAIVYDLPIIQAYQRAFELYPDYDILGYLHDDLLIHEQGWDERVLREFEDEKVGLVGIAGAPGHGHPLMYQVPYHFSQLGRVDFRSNLRDAEQHGTRFTEECDVAVLDGMALFVRREVLQEMNGWPVNTPVSYFMYTEFLCCMMRRLGYRIRLVGIDAEHLGGKSTGLKSDQVFDFEGEHRYIYSRFKDVLPAEVKP